MKLTLENPIANGNHQIKIVDFRTHFIDKTNMWNMSESQAFISVPTFLVDLAQTQFRTSLSQTSRHGGITSYSEAMQYIFRTYTNTVRHMWEMC